MMNDTLLKRFERLPLLDRIFDVSVTLKGIDGLLELVGGILLLLLSPEKLNAIVRFLTQHELSEDPNDVIATHLVRYAHSFTTSGSLFLAAYLLSHGLVKIILVVAVLKEKLWAYPWMIAFLLIFIAYQVYQLVLKLSVGLLLLTAFDLFIVYLTVLEYRKHMGKAVGAQ
ncbi:MAG TPA: DUF2127 domain-containing protein [Chloroflexota bacterium]